MTIYTQLLIICPLVFIAGFIDSIAGGGGLISTPAYIIAGLPMHNVLATNKVMSTIGTTISASKFIKRKKVHWKTAFISAVFSFSGSFIGSKIALLTNQIMLKKYFTFILPFIAIFVLFNKGAKESIQKIFDVKMYIEAAFIGFFIGMYDGLIGAGTGTFLIFAYTAIIGFDYTTASGNAKIINLSSNIAAAVNYIFADKVLWLIAIPAALFNILGNYIGSSYAIKNGSKVIRKFLIVVLIAIFIKLIFDII